MMHKVKIEKFEGPLDLLLQLIEKQELDISEVSLAQVCEQYLEILGASDDIAVEELADFLVVASKLLYLKSRILLPGAALEAEEEGEDLANQLKLYKEFYDAAKNIEKIIKAKKFSYYREKIAIPEDIPTFNPPPSVTMTKLRQTMEAVIKGLVPFIMEKKQLIIKAINIQEKIDYIRNVIKEKAEMSFHQILKGSKSRIEAVVNFLAVLELVKQKFVVVSQRERFSEIIIKKYN